jgi:hypothetical protein
MRELAADKMRLLALVDSVTDMRLIGMPVKFAIVSW